MKKIIICLFACLSISLVFNSCSKDEASFDESLLIGTWQLSTTDGYEYYHYKTGGVGVYWYEGTTEVPDGRDFKWTLDKADLILTHESQSGTFEAPEYFTVTSLTSTTFKYKDDFGATYTLTKISK